MLTYKSRLCRNVSDSVLMIAKSDLVSKRKSWRVGRLSVVANIFANNTWYNIGFFMNRKGEKEKNLMTIRI